jgi:hypothetical protein
MDLNDILNQLNFKDLFEIFNKIGLFNLKFFGIPSLNQILNLIKNYLSSENFIFFLIVFILVFIIVKRILKLIQFFLSLITTFWLTLIVLFYLIRSGIFDKLFYLFNKFF